MVTDICQGHWLERSRARTRSRSSHTLLSYLHKNQGSLPKDAVMLLHKETVQKFGQKSTQGTLTEKLKQMQTPRDIQEYQVHKLGVQGPKGKTNEGRHRNITRAQMLIWWKDFLGSSNIFQSTNYRPPINITTCYCPKTKTSSKLKGRMTLFLITEQ